MLFSKIITSKGGWKGIAMPLHKPILRKRKGIRIPNARKLS